MITAKQADKLRKQDYLIRTYKFYARELRKISRDVQKAIDRHQKGVCRTYTNLSRGEYDMLKDICADYLEVGYTTWIDDKGKDIKGEHIYKFYLNF